MAAKMGLRECSGTTPEDRKNSFLIGCASLRFANLFDQTRPGSNHVIEIRSNTAPLLSGPTGKSPRQQTTMSDTYARRYSKARNRPATVCLMTGWVYFMLLLLTPMYLLAVCYLTPQSVQPTQLVPIGEFNGNGIFIVNNNGTLQWQLVEELVSPAPTGYYLTLPHSHNMDCPCATSKVKFTLSKMAVKRNSTGAMLPKLHERKRRALSEEGGERVGRDVLQMLKGSYENAKTRYMNVQREVMSHASKVEGMYKQQLSPRFTRSVRRGKLIPGSYLMFRLTRSLADDVYETGKNRTHIGAVSFKLAGKQKLNGPNVAEGKTNELGTGKKELSKRDVENDVQDDKKERGTDKKERATDKRGETFNDLDSEEIVSGDKMDASVANGADEKNMPQTNSSSKVDLRENPTANEVSEEKTDATIYKLDHALKVTMVPTVPLEEKEADGKDETDNKCEKTVDGKEMKKESVLGDNMEPAIPEKGFVVVEANDGTVAKDEKEKKSGITKKAMSENLMVDEEEAGEGKSLSEEPGMREEDKSPDLGESEMPTTNAQKGPKVAEPGETEPAGGISDIDAKEEEKN